MCNNVSSERGCINAVSRYVNSKYPSGNVHLERWKIGITNDPERRKKEIKKQFGVNRLTYWKCWKTPSKDIALSVERYFCSKGMNRCQIQRFHSDDSSYVYAFIIPSK